MKHCAHCHTAESRYTLPGTSVAVCSETCLLAYLFALVEAMTEDEAQRRLAELRRKPALVSEEADLLAFLCQRLGKPVTWVHMNLTTGEVREGRGE